MSKPLDIMKIVDVLYDTKIVKNHEALKVLLGGTPEKFQKLICINLCFLMTILIPELEKNMSFGPESERFQHLVMDIGNMAMKSLEVTE